MTVKHIVLWNLAAADEAEKAQGMARIEAGLLGLIGKVPSIRSLRVERNGAYPDSNADIAVIADFDDYAGLEAYQVHPDHLEVVAIVRSLVSSRAGIDYEY